MKTLLLEMRRETPKPLERFSLYASIGYFKYDLVEDNDAIEDFVDAFSMTVCGC